MQKKGPTTALPPLLELGTPQKPSSHLKDLYGRELAHAKDVFDPTEYPEMESIPESANQFLRGMDDTRDVQRILVHEALTNLDVLGKRNFKTNGKIMHPHQRAHAFWSATTLGGGKEAPNSVLLRGAPGTGKTLELGQWMQAGVHAQIRELLPKGVIAYLTQRPFHLVQQTRGYGMARKRLLRTPGFTLADKEIDALYRECKKMIPGMCSVLTKGEWQELFSSMPESEADARSRIQLLLHRKGALQKMTEQEGFVAEETQLIKLLLGSAATVQGISQKTELVDLPEFAEGDDVQASFGGDAAFALPDNYPVLAKERWGMNAKIDEASPKVLLLPAAAFTSVIQREKLQAILKNVVLILLDEAGNWHPSMFENPVQEAKGKKPVVIAATATDQGKQWQARSPEHSVSTSVENGVLPDVGVDIFPSQQELHYPRESMQALSQLVSHHFEELPLMKRLKLQQPSEGNGLIVVHASATRECAAMLQKEHDKRKTGGKVFCLDSKTPQQDKEKLLLWLGSNTTHPKTLVGNPASLATALDLPNIWNVTLGTNVSETLMTQILGRALHSAGDRVLFRQQQFADSKLSTTPFAELEHTVKLPEEGGFRWVPGHALMSKKAHEKDKGELKKSPAIPSREVPPAIRSAKKTEEVVTIGKGTNAAAFLHPLVSSALNKLSSEPTRGNLAVLEGAFQESGNIDVGATFRTYRSALSIFVDQNGKESNFKELFCTKLMELKTKTNGNGHS